MSEIAEFIEAAARLPLKDAAFHLWSKKREIDRLEFSKPAPTMANESLSAPGVFKKAVQKALKAIWLERATAHDGTTFDRLKRAHPDADDQDIKQAIKAAVKLDQDCTRSFSYQSPDYADDVRHAVSNGRKDNPGFLESTYKAVENGLLRAMR